MPEITHQTLAIAIQAVAAEIKQMRESLAEGDGQAEEYQALEDRLRAAEDLEQAYDIAARTMINLPPYDQLVGA